MTSLHASAGTLLQYASRRCNGRLDRVCTRRVQDRTLSLQNRSAASPSAGHLRSRKPTATPNRARPASEKQAREDARKPTRQIPTPPAATCSNNNPVNEPPPSSSNESDDSALDPWCTEVTSLIRQIVSAVDRGKWIEVAGLLDGLDEMCDPMLSSTDAIISPAPPTTTTSTSSITNHLRHEALSALLSAAKKGTTPTRLRAVRSALKLLRVDIANYCAKTGRRDPKMCDRDTIILTQLGSVCATAFSASMDPTNDAEFVATEALGALLSFLGGDAELLLGVAIEYVRCRQEGAEASVRGILQPLIHAAAALKNLSVCEAQHEKLASLGAVHVCTGLLVSARRLLGGAEGTVAVKANNGRATASNTDKAKQKGPRDGGIVRDSVVTLLVQVTGALRNLSMTKAHHRQIVAAKLPQALCSLISPLAQRSRELMLNIVRVLSKLSLHESLRAPLNTDTAHIRDLMYLLQLNTIGGSHVYEELLQPHTVPIVVRVAFILGNLTAGNNANRRLLGLTCRGVETLVELIEIVGGMYLAMREGQDEDDVRSEEDEQGAAPRQNADTVQCAGAEGNAHLSTASSTRQRSTECNDICEQLQEVLIKLLRVVGNISIDRDVGRALAREDGIETVVSLLSHAVEDTSPSPGLEELLLNTVAALSNLTYYMSPDDRLHPLRSELSMHLYDVLLHDHGEAVAEAARALGNLSRDADVRAVMTAIRADRALVYLLDHSSRDVVFVVLGALVNLSADSQNQAGLLEREELGLGLRLARLLRATGLRDVELSCVACKALYNWFSAEGSAREALGEAEFEVLCSTLGELVETMGEMKGRAGAGEGGYAGFLGVAGALKRRLQSAMQAASSADGMRCDAPPSTARRDREGEK